MDKYIINFDSIGKEEYYNQNKLDRAIMSNFKFELFKNSIGIFANHIIYSNHFLLFKESNI